MVRSLIWSANSRLDYKLVRPANDEVRRVLVRLCKINVSGWAKTSMRRAAMWGGGGGGGGRVAPAPATGTWCIEASRVATGTLGLTDGL